MRLRTKWGPLGVASEKMDHSIVNRLSCGTAVQKLCASAVEAFDSLFLDQCFCVRNQEPPSVEEAGKRKNQTLICAPIMADTVDQILNLMQNAKVSGADLVEVRLDSLKCFNPRHDIATMIEHCPLPTLFTYRPTWEGGQYDGDEKSQVDALHLAMELGADYINVELKAVHEFNGLLRANKPAKCKIIVSSHNYQKTPSFEELSDLVAKIQESGADIVKIATYVLDITDVTRVFKITLHSQLPIISIAMGEKGLISRILSPKFGCYLTFGTLETGRESAPGQPTILDLLYLYNFRQFANNIHGHGREGFDLSDTFPKVWMLSHIWDSGNGKRVSSRATNYSGSFVFV